MNESRGASSMRLPSARTVRAWWVEGMTQCLPERLRAGAGTRRRRVLHMVDDGFLLESLGPGGGAEAARFPSLQALTRQGLSGTGRERRAPLHLRLPDAAVFRRTVELPQAAAASLHRVLQFEMDRLTPFADTDVLFDYRLLPGHRERGQVRVELAVVPRERVAAVLEGLEALGTPPRAVDAPGLWAGANLLRSHLGPRGSGGGRGRWLIPAAVLALAAAVLATPLLQARAVLLELDARVQQARSQAAEVARLQGELQERADVAGFVTRRQREQIPVVEVLREMTERLPDDTWLEQLSISGADVTVQGESAQATRLVELLEESPLFESVALRAPLTRTRDGAKERFSMALTLTPKAPPPQPGEATP